MIKVGMVSLGCPKNRMDAEIMLARLKKSGFELVSDVSLADVMIVNTCGFIEEAKRESIEQILEFGRLKDEGIIKKIIVTGCMAERYREEVLKELPECDAVLGLGANRDIVKALNSVLGGGKVESFPDKSCWNFDGERLQTTPWYYAYIRIGDGCSNCCSYCAIPSIRGKLRSREMDSILDEARGLAQNGVKELILVAQDTTLYGVDIYGRPMLPELLKRLCEIGGIKWIRVLYCYPEHVTGRLLDVISNQEKIVKYLDLPIQHVSKKVLKAMNRPGDYQSLKHRIQQIRAAVPGIVLRTTVMTGFPGEGEKEFDELCRFINETRFERLGCFAFSPEEGTPAAVMPNQVEDSVKQRRREIVMQEQSRISDWYNNDQIGRTLNILVEGYDSYAECWFGRSEADAPEIDGKVFFRCAPGKVKPGDMTCVLITSTIDWDLMGECCE
ncbi:MAG: 30S ribosomal protein S12 methylthiotransferase RimO [Clostridiales bacterium]|nr:30S ribosomal protein S12 methylthiotransferase RimO [Clostridiales bacterium]